MNEKYHVDWHTGGYRPCRDPNNCAEAFHSDNKIECVREYERRMLPIFQEDEPALDTLPRPVRKVRRPSRP